MSIKVTFTPTPIFGITNGIGYSNPFTLVLTTIIGISIDSMGKYKVQETMANSTPLIGFGSLVVVTTSSLWKRVVVVDGYIGENLWEVVTCTWTSLPIN